MRTVFMVAKPNGKFTEDELMKKKILMPIAAGVIAMSLFAGCAGAHNSGTYSRGDHYDEPMATTALGAENYLAGDEAFDKGVYEYGYEAEDWDMSDSRSTVSNGGSTISGEINNEVTVDPEQGRLLIRTVSISAETLEFNKVKSDLEAQVKALGGYIENSSMSGTGKDKDLRTAYYTVRVPADQLDSLVEKVGNSCTILSSSETSTDVTLQYVDTQARIESLRVEYDQLMKLLEEAEDLDTIFSLQQRLTEVRYEIESDESYIRVLENQVLYATLNISLSEVIEETVIEEPHIVTFDERIADQFADTKERTVEFFEDLVLDIIAGLPGLIVFGVFLLAGAVVAIVIVVKVKKKRAKARAQLEAAKKAEEKKAEEKKAEAKKEEPSVDTKEEGKE